MRHSGDVANHSSVNVQALILGARNVCGNLLHAHKPQHPQFSDKSSSRIFIRCTAMGELAFRLIRSTGEDCNSRSHPAVNETGSFKWSSSFGFARNDDNISAPDAVIDNEHPSSALGIECRIAGTAMLNAPTVQVGSNTVRSCGTGVEAAA